MYSRIHARMSNSINSAKRATAGITRKHSRLSIFAASAATAGVLGAAGLAVGSAPWSQAAGDAAKTGAERFAVGLCPFGRHRLRRRDRR